MQRQLAEPPRPHPSEPPRQVAKPPRHAPRRRPAAAASPRARSGCLREGSRRAWTFGCSTGTEGRGMGQAGRAGRKEGRRRGEMNVHAPPTLATGALCREPHPFSPPSSCEEVR
eukprot:212996-Chlamydomonas_euryale.AAC.1